MSNLSVHVWSGDLLWRRDAPPQFFTASTKGNNFYYSMFASLDKEAPPKEVYSKMEETFSHRIATSILYELNLRLEVKKKTVVLLS